jgi:hypothetical protein
MLRAGVELPALAAGLARTPAAAAVEGVGARVSPARAPSAPAVPCCDCTLRDDKGGSIGR